MTMFASNCLIWIINDRLLRAFLRQIRVIFVLVDDDKENEPIIKTTTRQHFLDRLQVVFQKEEADVSGRPVAATHCDDAGQRERLATTAFLRFSSQQKDDETLENLDKICPDQFRGWRCYALHNVVCLAKLKQNMTDKIEDLEILSVRQRRRDPIICWQTSTSQPRNESY